MLKFLILECILLSRNLILNSLTSVLALSFECLQIIVNILRMVKWRKTIHSLCLQVFYIAFAYGSDKLLNVIGYWLGNIESLRIIGYPLCFGMRFLETQCVPMLHGIRCAIKLAILLLSKELWSLSKENVQQKCLNMDYCDNICADKKISVLLLCRLLAIIQAT